MCVCWGRVGGRVGEGGLLSEAKRNERFVSLVGCFAQRAWCEPRARGGADGASWRGAKRSWGTGGGKPAAARAVLTQHGTILDAVRCVCGCWLDSRPWWRLSPLARPYPIRSQPASALPARRHAPCQLVARAHLQLVRDEIRANVNERGSPRGTARTRDLARASPRPIGPPRAV